MKKICVFGDIMLDWYEEVEAVKISEECPGIVFHHIADQYRLGGAANTANNCKALGNEVILVGVIGNDIAGNIILEELEKLNIFTNHIIQSDEYQTVVKKRIFDSRLAKQQVLRLDYEQINTQVSYDDSVDIRVCLVDALNYVDVLAISDYDKGLSDIIPLMISQFNSHNKYIAVNGKPQNMDKYRDADLVVLNEKEFNELKQIHWYAGDNYKNLIVTRGPNGADYYNNYGNCNHIDAVKTDNVVDICGAGDTFFASIVCSDHLIYANEINIETLNEAAFNASCVIQQHWTSTI